MFNSPTMFSLISCLFITSAVAFGKTPENVNNEMDANLAQEIRNNRLVEQQRRMQAAAKIDELNSQYNRDYYNQLRENDLKEMERTKWENYFTLENIESWKENKRIRKEIRDIPYSQWQKIADAMNIMKFTNEQSGIIKYGTKFQNLDNLLCLHSKAAHSTVPTDSMNDYSIGNSNNNEHEQEQGMSPKQTWNRAFLTMFEESLIAIDSDIKALPYWDVKRDISDPMHSIIFSDKYFGTMLGNSNNVLAIQDGPFKRWSIPKCDNVDSNKMTSVNDLFFMFSDANMDRHSFMWQMKNYHNNNNDNNNNNKMMMNNPLNLDDTPMKNQPLYNIFDNMPHSPRPLTNRDILDATRIEKSPFIYGEILDAIEARLLNANINNNNKNEKNNNNDIDNNNNNNDKEQESKSRNFFAEMISRARPRQLNGSTEFGIALVLLLGLILLFGIGWWYYVSETKIKLSSEVGYLKLKSIDLDNYINELDIYCDQDYGSCII